MMSRRATFFRSLIKAGVLLGPIALAATPATPALADSGPAQVLYIFPGVKDDGAAIGAGVATSVHCFSFSSTTETIQIVVRNFNGTLAVNASTTINFLVTKTISTHGTNIYNEDVILGTGLVDQGSLGITATSTNIVCTAQVLDASTTAPNGFDLHAVRFNPISGNQE